MKTLSETFSDLDSIGRSIDAKDARIRELEDKLDMMRDEFARISVSHGCTEEIRGLCDRSAMDIGQAVPVITQRDAAQADAIAYATKANLLEAENATLRAKLAERDAILKDACTACDNRDLVSVGLALGRWEYIREAELRKSQEV